MSEISILPAPRTTAKTPGSTPGSVPAMGFVTDGTLLILNSRTDGICGMAERLSKRIVPTVNFSLAAPVAVS